MSDIELEAQLLMEFRRAAERLIAETEYGWGDLEDTLAQMEEEWEDE